MSSPNSQGPKRIDKINRRTKHVPAPGRVTPAAKDLHPAQGQAAPPNLATGTEVHAQVVLAKSLRLAVVTISEHNDTPALAFQFFEPSGNSLPPIVLPNPPRALLDGMTEGFDDIDRLNQQAEKEQKQAKKKCSGCGAWLFGERLEIGLCIPCDKKRMHRAENTPDISIIEPSGAELDKLVPGKWEGPNEVKTAGEVVAHQIIDNKESKS